MFRVLIWGECAILLAIAALVYVMVKKSDTLKDTVKAKLMVYGIILMAIILFLLSFDIIRISLARMFL